MPVKNMLNFKAGMLTVVEFSHISKRSAYWKAKCECGNTRIITTGELNRGRTCVPSCGCYKPPITDYSGKRFNRLLVISFSHQNEKGKSFWICKCDCGNEKVICSESFNRNMTKSCGCLVEVKSKILRSTAKERILERISEVNGCWFWNRGNPKRGYGKCGLAFGDQSAHRASYKAFKGEIPIGMYICHTCDNPCCVNPDHLYAGTPKDNVRDALERGQFPKGLNPKKASHGIENGNSKISEDDVRKIRKLYCKGLKSSEIGRRFNINRQHVVNIAKGRSWKYTI